MGDCDFLQVRAIILTVVSVKGEEEKEEESGGGEREINQGG
jgi:hypothetical protein